MSSHVPGTLTSAVEVTNISNHGLWPPAGDREPFFPDDQFPWFREAAIKVVLSVQEPTPGHFYWPALGIDSTTEVIEHPERFPLQAKSSDGPIENKARCIRSLDGNNREREGWRGGGPLPRNSVKYSHDQAGIDS